MKKEERKKQAEEESVKVGLRREDALFFISKWSLGVNQIASGHPHLLEILTDCCWVEVILATLTCWR